MLNRRLMDVTIASLCCLAFCSMVSCKGTTQKPVVAFEQKRKPNILLIYTDQQRFNTIRALGNGYIKTPNLDKLVKTGMAFTNAYVTAPVCLPSRNSLFSGMYTTSNGSYSNHHSGSKPQTNLVKELKNNGYKTALIGKNHSFLNKEELDVIINTPKFHDKPADGRTAERAMAWKVEEDPMAILTDSTMSLLRSNDSEAPYFVWLSYLHPHTPYALPEPYFSMYDSIAIPEPVVEAGGLEAAGKPFRQIFHQENNDRLIPYDDQAIMRMRRNYFGMISMVDAEVGRLLNFLDKEKLRDETLIIFTSDHGDYMGDHGMVTKSPAMYDCLTRVSLIWNWNSVIQPGVITDELISAVDIMPTTLSLLDMDVPPQVQGLNFSDLLTGKNSRSIRDYVFAEYGIPGKPLDRNRLHQLIPDYAENPIYFSDPRIPWEANPVTLAGRFRMIRNKEWKFVQELNGTSELYNMVNDPNELVNLWNDPRFINIQQQLQNDLEQWKSELPGIEKDSLDMGFQNIQKFIIKRNKTSQL